VQHISSIISPISTGGFLTVSMTKQKLPIGVTVKFLSLAPEKVGEGLA